MHPSLLLHSGRTTYPNMHLHPHQRLQWKTNESFVFLITTLQVGFIIIIITIITFIIIIFIKLGSEDRVVLLFDESAEGGVVLHLVFQQPTGPSNYKVTSTTHKHDIF